MSKFYLMAEKPLTNGTIIFKKNNLLTPLKTGHLLLDNFKPPLICNIDNEHLNGVQPTFYMSPAIIGKKEFYQDLLDCGVDNIEVKPVVIRDTVKNLEYTDYLLLNILRRVSCVNLNESDYETLGDDMSIIDKLVLKKSEIHDLNMFLVHEDTDCIVISEQVHSYLTSKGYEDIYFEELEVI